MEAAEDRVEESVGLNQFIGPLAQFVIDGLGFFVSLPPSYGDNNKKTIMQQLGK
jgi:hypothetical protein